MDSEIAEITDKEFVAYFVGSIDHALAWSEKGLQDAVDPFFAKMSEELVKDMTSDEIYWIFFTLLDCTNIRTWQHKFQFMIASTRSASVWETKDEFAYPTNQEIMAFFIGYTYWLPIDTVNYYEVRENFLKCVWKSLCSGMEWEDVLDLLYFFDTEQVVIDWVDILIGKLGIRKQITYPDKPFEETWDTSEEGLEKLNFQRENR